VSGCGGDSYLEEIENKNVKNLSFKKMCFYMKLAPSRNLQYQFEQIKKNLFMPG